ncbi:hypothetical protein RR46_14928 [Papilio xuthus]|uniref:Uncharacterized protein n=1 Tax=Papilio xuthus TaxID=66420 RepID=A0A194PFE9_PAPXU|nr:hypothetical protein RR46_14928 [Papilio xuthus]
MREDVSTRDNCWGGRRADKRHNIRMDHKVSLLDIKVKKDQGDETQCTIRKLEAKKDKCKEFRKKLTKIWNKTKSTLTN